MLKKIFLSLLLLSVTFQLKAEQKKSDQKQSSYRYIIDNYFSKRSSKANYTRFFSLSSSLSVYRVNSNKELSPFSSFMLSFSQNVKEVSYLGDIQLRASILGSYLQNSKELSIELTPYITFPEAQVRFPIYFGLGLGLGFYPMYVIEKKPSFSVHSSFLLGLRFFEIYHNLGVGTELNMRIHFPLNELQFYLETMVQAQLIFQF